MQNLVRVAIEVARRDKDSNCANAQVSVWAPGADMRRLTGKADMPVRQALASGLVIRQDFRDTVRFVFFDTSSTIGNTRAGSAIQPIPD